MNPWKHLALTAYYYATLPARQRSRNLAIRERTAPIVVLFYHRIADKHPNDWTMSTRKFARQIRWIKQHYDVVTLHEAQQRIASGENEQPTVAITFDDGYAENSDFALPFLADERVPYTYFVTLDNVAHSRPFPHDVKNKRPLPPNTLQQLRDLPEQYAEIGAHTRTHPDLGQINDEATLMDEIVGARDELAHEIRRPVRYFAFPFGLHTNLNTQAFRIASEAGFLGVCSAYGGYNLPGDDPFHIQRIHADPELVRLKNWLTVDPRKLETPRFTYQLRPAITSPVGTSII